MSGRLTGRSPRSPSDIVLELIDVSAPGRPRYEATVEPLGRFTILDVPPGRYTLTTRGSAGVTVDVGANGVTGVDLPLEVAAAP